MYTLYCRKSAGSAAVEALLEACGATYKTIDLERNPDGSFPEFFHRINPKAEVPTLRLFYPERFTTDAAGSAGIKAKAEQTMAREFEIYAEALGSEPFMLGRMTALDIYAAMLVNWAPDINALFAKHANLKAMYEAVTAVPAVKRVWERNGM